MKQFLLTLLACFLALVIFAGILAAIIYIWYITPLSPPIHIERALDPGYSSLWGEFITLGEVFGISIIAIGVAIVVELAVLVRRKQNA